MSLARVGISDWSRRFPDARAGARERTGDLDRSVERRLDLAEDRVDVGPDCGQDGDRDDGDEAEDQGVLDHRLTLVALLQLLDAADQRAHPEVEAMRHEMRTSSHPARATVFAPARQAP